mgnify:CR=1 FL=1
MRQVSGQLSVEVELRSRLELREGEKHKEHTAVCAQLLAPTGQRLWGCGTVWGDF